MGLTGLVLIALVLAIDAFAVAVCIGVKEVRFSFRTALKVGLFFGGFQALMPVLGFFAGGVLANIIHGFDHYIVFFIFAVLGGKMVYESFKKDKEDGPPLCNIRTLLLLAFATSVDAFAAGVTFAFQGVNIIWAAVIIGVIAFSLSILGVRLGGYVGEKFKKRAELIGGIILIILGLQALILG